MPRFSRERITPVCIELHFLPIKARINYKICLLTYKALKHGQPSYLLENLQLQVPVRPLRSGQYDRLVEPIIGQSSYSDRCFGFCAPRMFNALPESIRQAPSILTFKSQLKTYLFQQAYDLNNMCISGDFNV